MCTRGELVHQNGLFAHVFCPATRNAHTKVVEPINDNHFPLVLIKFEKYIYPQRIVATAFANGRTRESARAKQIKTKQKQNENNKNTNGSPLNQNKYSVGLKLSQHFYRGALQTEPRMPREKVFDGKHGDAAMMLEPIRME